MELYVVQHGAALAKKVDPERPLSEQGIRDVESVAAFMAGAAIRVGVIFHSGKRRAAQTAEILARRIGREELPKKLSGIGPLDPVESLVPMIDLWCSNTMVVGHQPFMGRLVSLLAGRNTSIDVVAFCPGTVVRLDRLDDGGWSAGWMIRPELVVSHGQGHR